MSIRVDVPQQLRNYTNGVTTVIVEGHDVDSTLSSLDNKYPGIRFRVIDEQGRVREHMRVFANGERVRRLDVTLNPGDLVQIFGALSGG